MSNEKIKDAAIKFHFSLLENSYDLIVTGKNYRSIMQLMNKIGFKNSNRVDEILGFITNKNRFITRSEASKYMKNNNF